MSSHHNDDDLDAFFAAAESNDPDALSMAAEHIADIQSPQESGVKAGGTAVAARDRQGGGRLDGEARFRDDDQSGGPKFVAIEPEEAESNAAFTVVPYRLPISLPWWVWASVGVVLLGIFFAVMFMPSIELSTLTARLEGNNASSQSAMRQLVMRGDERTVNKLYEMASSQSNGIEARLRAIDVLSLISEPSAERALLRLELASNTDARVRQYAIAARKQREAAAARRQHE